MSEPAEDTAIEITPKTETQSGRVPKIVAEINRVASRVREKKKKEKELLTSWLNEEAPANIPFIFVT